MSGPDEPDDLDAPIPTSAPRKSGGKPVYDFLLVVGVPVIAILACLTIIAIVAMRGAKPAPDYTELVATGSKVGRPTQIYTRDEFKQLVLEKSPNDVLATMGPPDSTQDISKGTHFTWTYLDRVTNPSTRKPGRAVLEFQDGKVVSVRW